MRPRDLLEDGWLIVLAVLHVAAVAIGMVAVLLTLAGCPSPRHLDETTAATVPDLSTASPEAEALEESSPDFDASLPYFDPEGTHCPETP